MRFRGNCGRLMNTSPRSMSRLAYCFLIIYLIKLSHRKMSCNWSPIFYNHKWRFPELYFEFPVLSPSWVMKIESESHKNIKWKKKTSDWRPPEQRYLQNRETANVGLDSSVGRAPACQSWGHRFKSRSSQFFFVHPNLSKMYPVSFHCSLLHDIWKKKTVYKFQGSKLIAKMHLGS